MVTASQVKDLREKTGAGMMDCKKVLTETDGDMEKAIELLRERGIAKAAKKSGRVAAEGLVDAYIAENGKVVAVVEVNSETDFVAKNEEFINFVQEIANTTLSNNPSSIEELREMKFAGTEETVTEKLNSLIAKIGENMNVRRADVEEAKGAVIGYLHGNSRIAVLVNLESDASHAELEELGKDIEITGYISTIENFFEMKGSKYHLLIYIYHFLEVY